MTAPAPASRRPWRTPTSPLATLLAVTLLGLAGCGGAQEDSVEGARMALERGDLEYASRLLADVEPPAADELVEQIAEWRGQREVVRAEVERRMAALDLTNAKEVRDGLRALRDAQTDPGAAEIVSTALSHMADQLAELKASRSRTARAERGSVLDESAWRDDSGELDPYRGTREPSGAETDPVVGESSASVTLEERTAEEPPAEETAPDPEALLEELRAEHRLAMQEREWSRGVAILETALAEARDGRSGIEPTVLLSLRNELLVGAREEAVELVSMSARIEAERGVDAAREYLLVERSRFPREGQAGLVHEEIKSLDVREAILTGVDHPALVARAAPSTPPVASAVEEALLEAARIAESAREVEEAGDLTAARERWLEAAAVLPPGDRRDRYVGRADDLDARNVLRTEVDAARTADPAGFADLDLAEPGAAIDWEALPLGALQRAAGRAQLSARARVGLLLERLRRGDEAEVQAALAELGARMRRREIGAYEAWGLVARHLDQPIPDGGYVFEDGRWLTSAQVRSAELTARIEALGERLGQAGREEREALLEEVVLLARETPSAAAALAGVLAERHGRLEKALHKGGVIDRLADLAGQRRRLDEERERALALIFDTVEYFYPYAPPECPPEKARLYPAVQRRVDELVDGVRTVWRERRAVSLPPAFRGALEELSWSEDLHVALALPFEHPEDLPEWLEGVDPELESLDLATFAWDAREREDLARDRAIRALNRHRWETETHELDRANPSVAERSQVEITNDYRVMMGRCALAWNPKIQAAAQWHSDYMANTGDFGHFENDPERRTPGDRMRMEGYETGASENCSAGGAGPEDAHVGWLHSSGHHRNILMRGHREMASGLAAYYWTQNFGAGMEFMELLKGSGRD